MPPTIPSPVVLLDNSTVNHVFSSPIEVHLVDKNDVFYQKGRILAENVYRQVWNTENLVDGNDYAVVVVSEDRVIGNFNIEIRRPNKHLKSEVFFKSDHWDSYFSGSYDRVAELSGLSVSQALPIEARQFILMILFFGTYTICQILGIDFWVTVQRKALNRILTKRLRLGFFPNEFVMKPQKEVPNDNYWNSSELPKIYYLDLKDSENINAFSLFSPYLSLMGVRWKFLSRFQSDSLPFSTFYNQFYHQSQCA